MKRTLKGKKERKKEKEETNYVSYHPRKKRPKLQQTEKDIKIIIIWRKTLHYHLVLRSLLPFLKRWPTQPRFFLARVRRRRCHSRSFVGIIRRDASAFALPPTWLCLRVVVLRLHLPSTGTGSTNSRHSLLPFIQQPFAFVLFDGLGFGRRMRSKLCAVSSHDRSCWLPPLRCIGNSIERSYRSRSASLSETIPFRFILER